MHLKGGEPFVKENLDSVKMHPYIAFMGARGATKREKVSKPAKTSDKASSAARKQAVSHKAAVTDHRSAPKSDRQQPYHHGDLHEALLKAAKRVAEREGINGLTLRAVAQKPAFLMPRLPIISATSPACSANWPLLASSGSPTPSMLARRPLNRLQRKVGLMPMLRSLEKILHVSIDVPR